jgi:hypothetical protein
MFQRLACHGDPSVLDRERSRPFALPSYFAVAAFFFAAAGRTGQVL